MHGSLEPGSKTAAKSGPTATGRRPSGGPKETQRSQQQAKAAAVKGGQAACPGGSLDSCIGRQKKLSGGEDDQAERSS
jgi:hypothetical protein